MHLRKYILIGILSLLYANIFGQTHSYYQLSGIVINQHTKYSIGYASVTVPADKRGANATEEGFFTIVVAPNDTLQFSAVGYKPKLYVVPDTLQDQLISIAVELTRDTLTLDAFVVYPWPSREEFREAFLAYKDVQPYTIGPIPGIRSKADIDTVPKPPSPIKNPISFLYEEVVKPIQWKRPKRDRVDELPEWK